MEGTSVNRTADAGTFFRPRRLGHANLFVNDWEKSFEFYNQIAGFEEVYRQPQNGASFVSNGNTYHDLGLTDTKSKYNKGNPPGLFHLAFELETEKDLVDGYNELKKSGKENDAYTRDHDVAHSLYKHDPDGNMVEIYADVIADWRAARNGVVTKPKPDWIPGVTNVPSTELNYPINPEIRIVKDAVFHAKRVTHVAFVTKDFEAMFRYYTGPTVGLTSLAGNEKSDYAVLTGTCGVGDLTLLRQRPGMKTGFHHVGFEVWDEKDLDNSAKALAAKGIKPVRDIDHPSRRAVTILDPSGVPLQFYVNRKWDSATIATADAETAAYLF